MSNLELLCTQSNWLQKWLHFSTWLTIKSTFLNDIFHSIKSSSLVWILFLLSVTDVGLLSLTLFCYASLCSALLCSAMICCVMLCCILLCKVRHALFRFDMLRSDLLCNVKAHQAIASKDQASIKETVRWIHFEFTTRHNISVEFKGLNGIELDWCGIYKILYIFKLNYESIFFLLRRIIGYFNKFLIYMPESVSYTSSTHGWNLNWETLKCSHTQQRIMYKQLLVDALNWILVIILIQWRENKTTNTDVFPNIWIFKLFKHLIITQPLYGIYLHRVPYGF